MTRLITTLYLMILLSYSVKAQFEVSGKVIGNDNKTFIAGATIIIKGATNGTVTDIEGEFRIVCNSLPTQIEISFPGYKSKIIMITLIKYEKIIAILEIDEEGGNQIKDRKIKNLLDVGYFGELEKKPVGFAINYSIQSIGKANLELNTSLTYSKNEHGNHNWKASLSKNFESKLKVLPDNLYFSYFEINNPEISFNSYNSYNFILSNEIENGFGFTINYGAERIENNSEELQNEIYALVGLSKMFTVFSKVGNAGLNATVKFNKNNFQYDFGLYKSFAIKGLTYVSFYAKYFDYPQIGGDGNYALCTIFYHEN